MFVVILLLSFLLPCQASLFQTDDPRVEIIDSKDSLFPTVRHARISGLDPTLALIIKPSDDRKHFVVEAQHYEGAVTALLRFHEEHKDLGFYEAAAPLYLGERETFRAPAHEFYGRGGSLDRIVPGHIMAKKIALAGYFQASADRLPLRLSPTISPAHLTITEVSLRPDPFNGFPPLFLAQGCLNFGCHRDDTSGSEGFSCCESFLQSRPFRSLGATITVEYNARPAAPPTALEALAPAPKPSTSGE